MQVIAKQAKPMSIDVRQIGLTRMPQPRTLKADGYKGLRDTRDVQERGKSFFLARITKPCLPQKSCYNLEPKQSIFLID